MAEENKVIYILTYFFALISGIIVYLIAGDNERLKFHAKQAIILGVIIVIVGFIPILSIISLLLWLYGIYIGYKAYKGEDIGLPFITSSGEVPQEGQPAEHPKHTTHAKAAKTTKAVKETKVTEDDDALKALKFRYAQGKITKKQFDQMKKDLE